MAIERRELQPQQEEMIQFPKGVSLRLREIISKSIETGFINSLPTLQKRAVLTYCLTDFSIYDLQPLQRDPFALILQSSIDKLWDELESSSGVKIGRRYQKAEQFLKRTDRRWTTLIGDAVHKKWMEDEDYGRRITETRESNDEYRAARLSMINALNEDPEFLRRKNEGTQAYYATPGVREERSRRLSKLNNDPEFQARRAESMREVYKDPERNRKIGEATARRHAERRAARMKV